MKYPRERSSGWYIGITLSVRLTIFGTWVYHHKTMCSVHSWSRYDLELWPKCQIICLCVRAITFSWFDSGLPHLAHRSITMRRCDMSIHVPDSMLTFDLKVKCIGFMTFLCVQASALLSYDIVIYFVWHEYITMVWCVVYIHELCMTLTSNLNIKIIFSPWIWVWQDVFALWHRHTKFWHMGVSPWDNMLCTFLTLVWPWPLTYMWVGASLLSFTHRFYLAIILSFVIDLSIHFLDDLNMCHWYNLNTKVWWPLAWKKNHTNVQHSYVKTKHAIYLCQRFYVDM